MSLFDDTGLPVVTVMPSSQSVEVTLNATFNTTVTGIGAFTYQWRHDGTIISEEGNTLIFINVTSDLSGEYSCTVRNHYNDTSSSSASLIITGMHTYVWCFNEST